MREKLGIKDYIDLTLAIIFIIGIFFYRHNMRVNMAITIIPWYLLYKSIMRRKNKILPKSIINIKKGYVGKFMLYIFSVMLLIIFIEAILKNNMDGLLLFSQVIPINLANGLDYNKDIYVYSSGIVVEGEAYEWENIKSYYWKKGEPCYMVLEEENDHISFKVPYKKRREVEEILKEQVD